MYINVKNWTEGRLPSAPPNSTLTEDYTAIYSGYMNLGFLFEEEYEKLIVFADM